MRALLLLPLLFSLGLAAPRSDSRSEQAEHINISNPLSPGEEHLSDLYRYLQEKDPLGENDPNMTRDTTLLHLYVLHDYDKSGYLDGLELMQMLYGVLSNDREKPSEDEVISIVDEVLAKQDVNRDGLLSAQELVSSDGYEELRVADSGGPAEELPVDSDLPKEEESEIPAEDHAVPQQQSSELAVETVSNDHEDEAVEEVMVEAEEMLTEEEDNKPDHEM